METKEEKKQRFEANPKQKKEIKEYADEFLKLTKGGVVIPFGNGLVGIGTLKKPDTHLFFLNKYLFRWVGSSPTGKTIQRTDFFLDDFDLEMLRTCANEFKENKKGWRIGELEELK